MRPLTRFGLVIVALLAAFALAGCPSGGDSCSSSGTSTCDAPAPGGY